VGKARLRDLQLKYQLFDVDKSGMINAEELGDVLRAVGMNPTAQHVTDLLKQYDYDNSGTLSFAEFVALWSEELQDVESDDKMFKRAFEFFDKDGNGNITLSEFKEVLTDLGDPLKDEECKLFFKLVDKDGDGMLNFNEFLGFLKGEREGPGSNESSPGPSPGK
jgi:Ca2+-binding EF-hand superfamily protein